MSFSTWLRGLFKSKKLKTIGEKPVVLHPLKLGLALSGGGTRGIAYIGVFKALREAGVAFDYVAGTSIGSLMGAAYCSGLEFEQMYDRVKKLRYKDIISSKIAFVPSKTERLENVIVEFMGDKNIEDLPKPLCIVAVDIITGKEVHLFKGKLSKAIAGSCAVPTVFTPVDFLDYRLYDGGLQNNIPADVVREMGADIVLAIDLNPTRGYGTTSTKYVETIKAAFRIMMKSNSVKGYIHSDYVLKLDLGRFDQRKLDGWEEMIEEGYQATKEELPEILKVLGMSIPNENIKETQARLKTLQKRAKEKIREEKRGDKEKNTEVFNVLGQVQRSTQSSEGSGEVGKDGGEQGKECEKES